MQYPSVMSDCIDDLVLHRGLSKSTQITYRSTFRAYGNWLVSQNVAKSVETLTSRSVDKRLDT